MKARAAIRQADLQRIIRAAKAEGMAVVTIRIGGAEVRIETTVDVDEMKDLDSVEYWRRKQDARKSGARRP